MAVEFTECASLNINYDIMGIATISYTILKDSEGWPDVHYEMFLGTRNFRGYVANASMNKIPFTEWYETHVNLVTVTN